MFPELFFVFQDIEATTLHTHLFPMEVNFLVQLMNICDGALIENLLYSSLSDYHEKELFEKICNPINN